MESEDYYDRKTNFTPFSLKAYGATLIRRFAPPSPQGEKERSRNLSHLADVKYSYGVFSHRMPAASLLEYHVLLALASGPLHGYAVAENIAAESLGGLTPRAGSLYRVIARLISSGLVTESDGDAGVLHPGLARRYYALTRAGQKALGDETVRLKQALAVAEKRLDLARNRS